MPMSQNWYSEYKKAPAARIRLFCFHHSGGGASMYFPWVAHLSPYIEMVAIQLPGRENRFSEALNNNLQDIVAELSKNFAIYKDKPFFVFGHSLGALVSFELVKAIYKSYSLFPCHMIVSGSKAPHLPFRMTHLSQLDDNSLKEELKVYGGIDDDIFTNNEIFELFAPIIRSDFSIYEHYKYLETKPFPHDILALSGTEDQTVTVQEILSWEKYTEGNFEHIPFLGKHFFIKDHQKKIIEIINRIGTQYI